MISYITNPTDECFAELEQLKINVASKSRDPADYQFHIGMQHINDEDSLVYETTLVTVRKGYIVAYRRLVTTADSKPREELTPIYIADVARMTALRDASPHQSEDSVSSAFSTPYNTPVARQQSISVTPDRVDEAPLNVPLQSSIVPGWNSIDRLATDTSTKKLSRELLHKTNLVSELDSTSKQGGRKSRSCVDSLPSLSCPQSYSQAKVA